MVRARSWHASAEGRMSERFMLRLQERAARLTHVLVSIRTFKSTHLRRHDAMLIVPRQRLRSRAERVVCVVISTRLVGTHRSRLVSERRAGGTSCNDGLRLEGGWRDRCHQELSGLLGHDGRAHGRFDSLDSVTLPVLDWHRRLRNDLTDLLVDHLGILRLSRLGDHLRLWSRVVHLELRRGLCHLDDGSLVLSLSLLELSSERIKFPLLLSHALLLLCDAVGEISGSLSVGRGLQLHLFLILFGLGLCLSHLDRLLGLLHDLLLRFLDDDLDGFGWLRHHTLLLDSLAYLNDFLLRLFFLDVLDLSCARRSSPAGCLAHHHLSLSLGARFATHNNLLFGRLAVCDFTHDLFARNSARLMSNLLDQFLRLVLFDDRLLFDEFLLHDLALRSSLLNDGARGATHVAKSFALFLVRVRLGRRNVFGVRLPFDVALNNDLLIDILERVLRTGLDNIFVALIDGDYDRDELHQQILIIGTGKFFDIVIGQINSIVQLTLANVLVDCLPILHALR